MYDRIIVAPSDEERRDSWYMLAELLRTALGDPPETELVACAHALQVEKLRRQNPSSLDLLILEADLEPGPAGLASDGIALAERLQTGLRPSPCILVGGGLASLSKARKWPLCEQLPCENPTEALLLEVLEGFARELARKRNPAQTANGGALAPSMPNKSRKWALLEVHLSDRPYFDLRIGKGDEIIARQDHSPFEVDPAELREIVDESRKLRSIISERLRRPQVWQEYVDRWQADYAELGKKVFKLIDKDDFSYLWGQAVGAVENNARLRFTLSEDTYDGLWESMYNQRGVEQEKWLMLKGTVARRAGVGQESEIRQLDGDDGAIHMLAIASNVEGDSVIQGPNAGFDNLMEALIEPIPKGPGGSFSAWDLFEDLGGSLDAEMDMLKSLEGERDLRGGPSLKIDFIRGLQGRPLHEVIRDKLTRGPVPPGRTHRYDVVHFAGHALFEEVKGAPQRGYLIFGNHPKETHAVPISEFAQWLDEADVQLAYLSCCRSSAARAAHELANSKVPLSIGFTWDLDGQGAVDFARAFYEQLLRNDAKVCPAFQSARKQLHNRHQGGSPIWTAPVLVAQPTEWHKVETCFTRH